MTRYEVDFIVDGVAARDPTKAAELALLRRIQRSIDMMQILLVLVIVLLGTLLAVSLAIGPRLP